MKAFTESTDLSLYQVSIYDYSDGVVGDLIGSANFHSLKAAMQYCDRNDAEDRRICVTRLSDGEIVYDC